MHLLAQGREAGFALSVRTADPAHWSELSVSDVPLVRDAGFTEIAPGLTVAVEGHGRAGALPKRSVAAAD